MKHDYTPGPWRISTYSPSLSNVSEGPTENKVQVYAILGPPDPRTTHPQMQGCPILAHVLGGTGCSDETLLADARLVATAPMLYAALCQLYEYATVGMTPVDKARNGFMTFAKMALRAAQGED